MRVAVINNRDGLVIGQMPHLGISTGGVPQPGEAVTFMTGLNLIDKEKLKMLRSNKEFDKLFKVLIERSLAPEQNPERVGRPILEIQKYEGKDVEVPDQTPLAKLPYMQCRQMIKETLSAEVLRAWLKEEGRAEVRRDLENHILYVTTGEIVKET